MAVDDEIRTTGFAAQSASGACASGGASAVSPSCETGRSAEIAFGSAASFVLAHRAHRARDESRVDGVLYRHFSLDQPGALADGLERVLTDKPLAAELRHRAYDGVRRHYDIGQAAAQLVAVYGRVFPSAAS